jgi:hypothetical protein
VTFNLAFAQTGIIRRVDLYGITAPRAGAVPFTAANLRINDPRIGVAVTWSPNHSVFEHRTVYTARVTLTALGDNIFDSNRVVTADIATSRYIITVSNSKTIRLEITFPQTAVLPQQKVAVYNFRQPDWNHSIFSSQTPQGLRLTTTASASGIVFHPDIIIDATKTEYLVLDISGLPNAGRWNWIITYSDGQGYENYISAAEDFLTTRFNGDFSGAFWIRGHFNYILEHENAALDIENIQINNVFLDFDNVPAGTEFMLNEFRLDTEAPVVEAVFNAIDTNPSAWVSVAQNSGHTSINSRVETARDGNTLSFNRRGSYTGNAWPRTSVPLTSISIPRSEWNDMALYFDFWVRGGTNIGFEHNGVLPFSLSHLIFANNRGISDIDGDDLQTGRYNGMILLSDMLSGLPSSIQAFEPNGMFVFVVGGLSAAVNLREFRIAPVPEVPHPFSNDNGYILANAGIPEQLDDIQLFIGGRNVTGKDLNWQETGGVYVTGDTLTVSAAGVYRVFVQHKSGGPEHELYIFAKDPGDDYYTLVDEDFSGGGLPAGWKTLWGTPQFSGGSMNLLNAATVALPEYVGLFGDYILNYNINANPGGWVRHDFIVRIPSFVHNPGWSLTENVQGYTTAVISHSPNITNTNITGVLLPGGIRRLAVNQQGSMPLWNSETDYFWQADVRNHVVTQRFAAASGTVYPAPHLQSFGNPVNLTAMFGQWTASDDTNFSAGSSRWEKGTVALKGFDVGARFSNVLLVVPESYIPDNVKRPEAAGSAASLTVAYIPLDDRPVNNQRVEWLAAASGFELLMPETHLFSTRLDHMTPNPNGTNFGDREGLYNWLKSVENDADVFVISLDQMLSGGLAPSRSMHGFADNLDFEYEVIDYIADLAERKTVYAFDVIMRLASTVNLNGYTNTEYDLLRAYGMQEREQLSGAALTIDNIIAGYRFEPGGGEIPTPLSQASLNNYHRARERNLKMLDRFIRKAGEHVEYLFIGVDDSRPEITIQTNEINYIRGIKPAHSHLFAGADELGMMALARVTNDVYNGINAVSVEYFGGGADLPADEWDIGTLRENVDSHLESLGLTEQSGAPLSILILTRGTPSEIAFQAGRLLDRLEENIANEIPTVIMELSDDNFEHRAPLQKGLAASGLPLAHIVGYSNWNTAGNAIGISMAHGVARSNYLKHTETATAASHEGFLRGMLFSWIKDVSFIRGARSTFGTSWSSAALQSAVMSRSSNAVHRNMDLRGDVFLGLMNNSDMIASLSPFKTARYGKPASVNNFRFPWNRNFEMVFDINF